MADRHVVRAWDAEGVLCAREVHRDLGGAEAAVLRLLADPDMVWVQGPGGGITRALEERVSENDGVPDLMAALTESVVNAQAALFGQGAPHLTEEEASRVYDVLAEECGAHDRGRRDFMHAATRDRKDWWDFLEYRFMGALGFGGKVHLEPKRIWVSQYLEDETAESVEMVRRANERLAEIAAERGAGDV